MVSCLFGAANVVDKMDPPGAHYGCRLPGPMKALTRLVIALSLTLIVSGCRTSRSVELRTSRAGVSATHTNGVTSDTAVEIFRDVANQMGFTVQGPERVS